MGGPSHHKPTLPEKSFIVDKSVTKYTFSFIITGIIFTIIGIIMTLGQPSTPSNSGGHAFNFNQVQNAVIMLTGGDSHAAAASHDLPHEPIWLTQLLANLLLNSFLFTGVAACAVFIIAIQYATNAGWFTGLKRIPEAMGSFLFVGPLFLLIVFIIGGHNLYHWTDANAVANDAILKSKSGYLNSSFFIIRAVLSFGIWAIFFIALRNSSRREDLTGGMKEFNKRIIFSGVFIILFALTFSMSAWDWIMSIDAHWFSTMFGVYVFASCLVTCFAMVTLSAVFLKNQGYLPHINPSHFHDLGKFMFAFSIFWTYIWFCQFLLIWYANIPEETIYFITRMDKYPVMFFTAVILNFVIPFLILLRKGNIRHLFILGFIAFVIIIGHWIDFMNMVLPGTMKGYGNIGFMEIGLFMLFLGLFLHISAVALSKANLVPKNHPYLDESLYHVYH